MNEQTGKWSSRHTGSPVEADAGGDPHWAAVTCPWTALTGHPVTTRADIETAEWPRPPLHALSQELVLRKPELVRDSGSPGTQSWAVAARTARLQKAPLGLCDIWQHCEDQPETPGGQRRFCPGHFLRKLRGQEDPLTKSPLIPPR